MDFGVLKWQILRGSLAWRLVLRAVFFAAAMAVLSLTRIANEVRSTEESISLLNFDKCSLNIGSIVNTERLENPRVSVSVSVLENTRYINPCVDGTSFTNMTVGVIRELMKKEMLSLDARSLCVGRDSDSVALTMRGLGFTNAFGVRSNPILSLLRKQLQQKLDFDANSLDLVFSVTLDRSSVPALLVLEIERVLRPGGVGAMLLGASTFHSRSLVRSATPVALLLRSSEILHVCGIGSFTLIVFKKRLEDVALFSDYKLPTECPSISKNKPFMKNIEPLVDQKNSPQFHEISYLPKFVNVSSRNRLIYINMGAGEFDRRYPIHPDAFNVYVVDHNVSALTSHVKKAGVTFVYHPGLVEDDRIAPSLMSVDYLEAPLHEEQFEFIDWFKETAKDGDFVVLMMNAGSMQLKVLFELFVSGAICHVDELFLRCSDGVDCRTSYCKDCASLFNGLRNAGVFVHQWS